MAKEIIPPVDRSLIETELLPSRFIKKTNNGDNEIYIVSAHEAPHTMREIGRLREVTFRDAGGGTGHEIDVDVFDTAENPFLQLLVWNSSDREIIGGYRFILGKHMLQSDHQQPLSPTAEIFNFSSKFIAHYLPVTIELGRSWVQPLYQPINDFRKGLYSLDNLWDGLGGLITTYPEIRYFFGKITMYTTFNVMARDLIMGFLQIYFPDNEKLVTPLPELEIPVQLSKEALEVHFQGENYDHDFKTLVKLVRGYGEQVPPLLNAYMNLSNTMKTFGTAVNPHFGGVEETGILVCIDDIYPSKTARHIKPS
jgi:hypothetical protein